MVAIKTADLTQDFKRVAERVSRGERILISRPRNKNLVLITEEEYNTLDKLRVAPKLTLKDTLAALQKQAELNGVADMSLDEINAEIKAMRLEKQ